MFPAPNRLEENVLKQQIRARLTYANVMSTIAVVLVVGGGTAFAATHLGKNTVKSRNIAPGAVKAQDLANGAVKRTKISSSAVDSSKLADQSVQGSKIANGAVSTSQLAPNSVDDSKLAQSLKGKLNTVQTGGIVRVDAAGTSPADSPERTLITRGPFRVYGKCYNQAGVTVARSYIASSAPGTLATGANVTYYGGANSYYLDPSTPEDNRRISNLGVIAANGGTFGGAATMVNGNNAISVAVNGWGKGSAVPADSANYGAGGARCLFTTYLLAASG